MLDNFKKFKSRGEIRKEADILLGHLGSALLKNVAYDNREEIKQSLKRIKESDINWESDVVRSVQDEYKRLTSEEVIKSHLDRNKKNFKYN